MVSTIEYLNGLDPYEIDTTGFDSHGLYRAIAEYQHYATQRTEWRWLNTTTNRLMSYEPRADHWVEAAQVATAIARQHRQVELVCEPARERARALLKSLITPQDWERYERYGVLHVIGGNTGQRYVLRNCSRAMNMHNTVTGMTLCCHPEGPNDMAIEDVLITQKMHLEHNEIAFVAKANVIRARFTPAAHDRAA